MLENVMPKIRKGLLEMLEPQGPESLPAIDSQSVDPAAYGAGSRSGDEKPTPGNIVFLHAWQAGYEFRRRFLETR